MKNEFMSHEEEKKQEKELKRYFELLTPEIPVSVMRRMERATFEKVIKQHKIRHFLQLITSPWLTVPAAAAAIILIAGVILLNSYDVGDMKVRGASFQVAEKSDTATVSSEDLKAIASVISGHSEDELARMDAHLAAIIDKPVDKYWKDEFVHGWDWDSDGSYDVLAGEDWL